MDNKIKSLKDFSMSMIQNYFKEKNKILPITFLYDGGVRLTLKEDYTVELNFMNVYLKYLNEINNGEDEKETFQSIYEQIFSMIDSQLITNEMMLDFEKCKSQIYPLVKSSLFMSLEQMNRTKIIFDSIATDILCTYILDTGNHMISLTADMLEKWKVNEKVVKDIAMDNFKRDKNIEPIELKIQGTIFKMFAYNTRDSYDATRIFLDDQIKKVFDEFKGNLLIGIPNRDFMIMFPSVDVNFVKLVKEQIALDFRTKEYSISENTYAWKNGRIFRSK